MPLVVSSRRVPHAHSMPNISPNRVLASVVRRPLLPISRALTQITPLIPSPAATFAMAQGPIAWIPNEVLAEIFVILREMSFHNGGWVRILQVCKHWSAVAHETTALWTYIYPNLSRLALQRFLVASKSRPLDVELCPGRNVEGAEDFMRVLGSHHNRIRTLSGVFVQHEHCHRLLPYIAGRPPASQIHHVNLKVTHPFRSKNRATFLSLNQCPSIRSVCLINIRAHFSGGILTSLTKLDLENAEGLPTLPTLVAIFRAAQNLQYLHLSGVYDQQHAHIEDLQATDANLPVRLANMKRIILRSDPEFPRDFLSIVTLPPAADTIICLPVVTLAGVSSTFLCYSLPSQSYLPNIEGLCKINALVLRFQGMTPSIAGYHMGRRGLCRPVLSISIVDTTYPPSNTPYQQVVESITQAIYFLGIGQRIVTVEVSGDEDSLAERPDLTSTFRALPSLRGVCVKNSYMESVLAALAAPLELQMDGEPDIQAAPCPHLKEVQAWNVTFNEKLVVNTMGAFERRKELGANDLKTFAICHSEALQEEHAKTLERAFKQFKYIPEPR